MATINTKTGDPSFDRTIDGGAGTGAILKKEGTEDKPFDPGLFQRLTDVHWGTHSTVTGGFICVGYARNTDLFLATADTNADASGATDVLNRGWYTTYDQIFIFAEGRKADSHVFDVCLRVPMFGHQAVLIAAGNYFLFHAAAEHPLVVVSTDFGRTWTDLRAPKVSDTVSYSASFLAWNQSTRTLYASMQRVVSPPYDHFALLYKFTPGSDPSVAGTWTLMKTDSFDGTFAPPNQGFPSLPTDILPVGTYIMNDTVYYDSGTNGYKYQGTQPSFGWYGGAVTFIGTDGVEHTLEQKVGDVTRVDGVPLQVIDDRFLGLNQCTAGNGLVVTTSLHAFDGSPDEGQEVLIGTADITALIDPLADGSAAHPFAQWTQISPSNITTGFFYISAGFGKNKL